MKIPFDIKYRPQIESGEYKVETRNGLPVRIICWDRKFGYPIVGLAYEKATGCESYVSAYADGTTSANGKMELSDDLFIITPDPELSEFEKALSKCLCDAVVRPEEEDYEKWAKEYAPELLELARKEIEEELKEKVLHDYWKQASDQCAQARKEAKAEALKDLPRWVKVNEGDVLDKYSRYLLCTNEGYYFCRGINIKRDGYMLLVNNLEKLPKEE